MKDIIKKGFKVFYLMFIANIMAFFLIISFNVISVVAFTEEIGYTAYGTTQENEEAVELYKHYYADGEDTQKKEFEDKGYTLTTPSIRSVPSKTADVVTKLIAGVICVMIMVSIIYSEMWKYGDKDRTAVKYKGKKENKRKGFIVGLFAIIPSLIFLIVLTVLKTGWSKSFSLLLFGLLNTYLYDFIYLIANGATVFGDFALWQVLVIALMFLVIPITCGISYLFGYNSISISEKLTYKNK